MIAAICVPAEILTNLGQKPALMSGFFCSRFVMADELIRYNSASGSIRSGSPNPLRGFGHVVTIPRAKI